MSRQIHIDSVSEENREQMMEELQITIEGSKFVYNSKPRYIYPLDVEGEYGYLPFAYARTCVGGPFDRPDKNNFSTISCKFEGTLREEQIKIKKEASLGFSHLIIKHCMDINISEKVTNRFKKLFLLFLLIQLFLLICFKLTDLFQYKTFSLLTSE